MIRFSLPVPSSPGPWLRALATYDAFPRLSARVRRVLYNPLGVLLLAALAALCCGAFLRAQGFVLCGSVLAVIALGLLWPWLSLRGLCGSIAFATGRAVEGEPVEAWLTLRNRLPWTAHGLAVQGGLRDRAEHAEEECPALSIRSAPRCRTVRCRWTFTPPRRGVYPLSTPQLMSGFPFGL
jgi:uncharacterized protein (DUF58 family)